MAIEQVKQLRDETGISISDCKKALDETNGDIEKAKKLLASWGKESAGKKADREVGDGRIEVYLHPTGKVGVMLDIRCETDFVAKGEDFQSLLHEIALQIASMNPEDVDELMRQSYIKDTAKTVKDLIDESIAKLGENIQIKRFSRFEI